MKKQLLSVLFLLCSIGAFGQGKSISCAKKNLTPCIWQQGDTLSVGDIVQLTEGTNGQFLYVQLV